MVSVEKFKLADEEVSILSFRHEKQKETTINKNMIPNSWRIAEQK